MQESIRRERFLSVALQAVGTDELVAAVAGAFPSGVEWFGVETLSDAREAVARETEGFAAIFVVYTSRSDRDGYALADAACLASSAPLVVLVDDDDFVAARSLAKVARAGCLTKSGLTATGIRAALAYASGAFDSHREQVALRRAVLDTTKARDRLAHSHATLERWAAELEIANARLREVDDLKTKFLSEVSHEIRTPLAAVVSAAKIIMKHHEARPDVVARFGNTILVEGERLTRLLNEFLDLTKIEAGCVEWHDGPIDAQSLVEDALAGMAAVADEKGIHLVPATAPGLPLLTADRDRLIQVLSNLLMNALKYTPPGGRVTLRASQHEGTVRFQVEDTGPGIPREELAKVFDRFHQVRRSDDRDQGRKGTGLGLCICREIVDHYGGRIWVESQVGEGSVFQFTLPLGVARESQDSANAAKHRNSHQVRVLLVSDDDALALRLLRGATAGEIEWAFCGALGEAVEAVATRKTDVVVVARSLIDPSDEDFLSRIQSYGVAHVLLLSEEHGLVEAGVLESSDAVARSLTAIAPSGSRVMVVEDDDHYRSLLEFQLAEEGYRVTAFDNGRDALDSLDTVAPDLVVLDLIMPGIDGLTLLQRIRSIDPRLPAVVLTAMDDPTVAVAARELGAIGVFRKDSSDSAPYRTVVARVRRSIVEALDAPLLLAEAS